MLQCFNDPMSLEIVRKFLIYNLDRYTEHRKHLLSFSTFSFLTKNRP